MGSVSLIFGNWEQTILFGGCLALAGIAWPNKAVKGTRRPLAVLKFRFYLKFGGFVKAL